MVKMISLRDNVALRIFCILLIIKGYETTKSQFQILAENTTKIVERNLHVQQCIQSAREKAYSVNEKYGDRHFAALWISMYSRFCMIDTNFLEQDRIENAFPFRLNKEIRCLKNTKRDPIIRETFVKVRNIINGALDVFGMKRHVRLYRGMTEWKFNNQNYFVEEGFFSTSTDPTPAFRFAKGKYLLIVQNMNGVRIDKYVEERFMYQKEVLGKSGKMFQIKRKVTDYAEIKEILSDLKVNLVKVSGVDFPHTIVYISEVSVPSERQSVIEKQWPSMKSYCSVDHLSSASHAFKRAIVIQFILVMLIFFW
ncbi:uncharacterized protein LOC132721154 [Ruditapes philippinarum]|uniref:uncharacterized protein LOC132721154 n=1 Tax=Ruditapes philippinarum TaxID=129788 RepID=UPI00295B1B48|nr:uncharacterized protein LOC132721154 [Ruditapes philippinarum]